MKLNKNFKKEESEVENEIIYYMLYFAKRYCLILC